MIRLFPLLLCLLFPITILGGLGSLPDYDLHYLNKNVHLNGAQFRTSLLNRVLSPVVTKEAVLVIGGWYTRAPESVAFGFYLWVCFNIAVIFLPVFYSILLFGRWITQSSSRAAFLEVRKGVK